MKWMVVARRFGKKGAHTYPVGIYSTRERAERAGENHDSYRGGKYVSEVSEVPGVGWYVVTQSNFLSWLQDNPGGVGRYRTEEHGLFESLADASCALKGALDKTEGREGFIYGLTEVDRALDDLEDEGY